MIAKKPVVVEMPETVVSQQQLPLESAPIAKRKSVLKTGRKLSVMAQKTQRAMSVTKLTVLDKILETPKIQGGQSLRNLLKSTVNFKKPA